MTQDKKAETKKKIEDMLGKVPGMVDGEIDDLAAVFAHYRDVKIEFVWPTLRLASLEKKMREHIKDTGETADIDGAKITFRKGSEITGINAKALLKAAAEDPALQAVIEPYVKITKRAPGISFKVD